MNKANTLLLILAVTTFSLVLADSLSRGWGDSIEWHTLAEAKELAASSNKPIMVIIHKTWCGACKRLKGEFGVSKEVAEMSSKFIMVFN